MNVAVQHGHRTKTPQVRKSLLAILGAPPPLRIYGPQRDVREDDDGRTAFQAGNVLLEPFELLGSEIAETAGLEIHYVHETDEVSAFLIEAVPAVAPRLPRKALAKQPAVVVEDVVLAWNVEDAIGVEALEGFGKRIELLGFRKMR